MRISYEYCCDIAFLWNKMIGFQIFNVNLLYLVES